MYHSGQRSVACTGINGNDLEIIGGIMGFEPSNRNRILKPDRFENPPYTTCRSLIVNFIILYFFAGAEQPVQAHRSRTEYGSIVNNRGGRPGSVKRSKAYRIRITCKPACTAVGQYFIRIYHVAMQPGVGIG